MRQYGESKTTGIMMATVPQVTSGSGHRKFQAVGFLLDRVYMQFYGMFSCVHISSLVDVDIDQIAYMDT